MKKAYIEPAIMVAYIGTEMIICGSDSVKSSGSTEEITYGGADEEGTKDPASRRHHDVWAEEEEELD